MHQSHIHDPPKPIDTPPHPICTTCDVPMWLVEVTHFDARESHRIYQCKVCEAKSTVESRTDAHQNTQSKEQSRMLYQPATLHSDSIVRPSCSECGTATLLVGIEPERPGYELHTFECPTCRNFETAVGKAA